MTIEIPAPIAKAYKLPFDGSGGRLAGVQSQRALPCGWLGSRPCHIPFGPRVSAATVHSDQGRYPGRRLRGNGLSPELVVLRLDVGNRGPNLASWSSSWQAEIHSRQT
jgi:hypothetical protein